MMNRLRPMISGNNTGWSRSGGLWESAWDPPGKIAAQFGFTLIDGAAETMVSEPSQTT